MRAGRIVRWAAVGAVCAVLPVGPGGGLARAEEAGALTVGRIYGGPPLTTPLPALDWRPGHSDLVQTVNRGDRRVVVSVDPLSGKETEVVDLTSLRALVEGDRPAPRGIGRAGPPELLWAPDGKALLAVVRGDLVWVDLAGGERRRLTRTDAPLSDLRISPDAAWVSFSRLNDLWAVPTAGGPEVRLTQGGSEDLLNGTLDWVYPEELGHDTAAWWSPDSRRVAYLQLDETGVTRFPLPSSLGRLGEITWMRYPKAGDKNPVARVGVVPVEGGETTWLDLGSPAPEYVARIAWFPDARHVAVVTLDRAQRRLRLLACDVADGSSRLLLEESDPAWVDVPPAPRFLGDRTFLWRSHRDGATRWWLVTIADPPAPPALRALTPPGVDADGLLDYDAKRTAALYLGTPHADFRESVYASAAPADGGSLVTVRAPFLRPGDGSVRVSLHNASGLALVTTSTATTPPRLELRRIADGSVVRVLGDARSPDLAAVTIPAVEYGALEVPGGQLRWRLWKPACLGPGCRYPVIVQVYGGPGSRMVRDEWRRGPFLEALLVEKGFLVLEVDGRGTGGQGARFERAVQGRLGLVELEDQVRGVKMLAERPYVDASRVGIWGWSFGGTMVCNALCHRSDVFRFGIAVAPVTDWRWYDTIYTERYMGLPAENPKGYDETSSVRAAGRMGGRLLLMHGMGDDNVHVQNSFRLLDALLKAGKPGVEAMIYPESGHGLGGRHVDVYGRLVAFAVESVAPPAPAGPPAAPRR